MADSKTYAEEAGLQSWLAEAVAKVLISKPPDAKKALVELLATSAGPGDSPATTPELIYFDGPGRANLTRLAFAAGGVTYKDTRYKMSDWPAVKSDAGSVPAQCFGSMPVIKNGDLMVAQSCATASYAAELGVYAAGRLGGTPALVAENRAIDSMLIQTNEDVRSACYACLFGSDESKAAGREALPAKAAKLLEGVERILARRRDPSCTFFFCPDGPTMADLAVYDNVSSPFPGLLALGVDLTPFPKVLGVARAVEADPAVRAYVEANGGFMKPVPPA